VNGAASSNGSEQAAPSRHPAPACTLQEAAAALGVSLNTLRRRIRSGEIRAERVRRPQGHVWRVYLPGEQPAGQHSSQNSAGTLQQPPADIQRAEAMASYSRSLLEPLVARLADQEQIIREQAEEIGRLRSELDHARTGTPAGAPESHTAGPGTASTGGAEQESTPTPGPWWRRVWGALVAR
jgi:excisionase family DNA binding protein